MNPFIGFMLIFALIGLIGCVLGDVPAFSTESRHNPWGQAPRVTERSMRL